MQRDSPQALPHDYDTHHPDVRTELESIVTDLRAVVEGLADPRFDPRLLLRRVSQAFRRNAAALTEHPDLAVDIFRGLHDALMTDASDAARREQPGGVCRLRSAQTELTVIIGAIYSENLWAFDYGDEKDFSLADAILHWQAHAHVPVDLLTLFEEALISSPSSSANESTPASGKPHHS